MARTYATAAELATYLGLDTPPEDADRLLLRASEALDGALMASVYAVDDQGYPSADQQREAVANAACAIVEWWQETGDELGANAQWTSVSAGSVSLSGGKAGASQVRPGALPPRAAGYLQRSGLLPGRVFTL